MRGARAGWPFTAVLLGSVTLIRAGPGDATAFNDEIRPLIDKYCVSCHGETKPKAGINLAQIQDLASFYRDFGLWEKVLQQLRDRQMPPAKKPRPDGVEYQKLVEWLEHSLDNPDPAWVPHDPGRTVIRRLSRTEYNHTIRDLLGVDSRPADRFPTDGGGGGGFDNNADTLFVPPILMEKYLAAADEILAAASTNRLMPFLPTWYRSERAAARRNLEGLAGRAYRRPLEPGEAERLLKLYERARQNGQAFLPALKTAYRAVLVSPNFLFRIESNAGPGRIRPGQIVETAMAGASTTNASVSRPVATRPLNDFELASRLSYFLWSSMPDDMLFQLAAKGKLSDPAVLEAQVGRMLADPKARALSDDFAGQWFGVRQFRQNSGPDAQKFPNFTASLREAMAAEPLELFHGLIAGNGSLLDLLDANYTYANEELARHYGLTGVTGQDLRRVSLPGRERGGLTGMGMMLVQTSYPLRSSPVLRGKWILEEILGTPPPPPPPLVKTLPPDDKPKDGLTFRKRLEEHRKDPNCAVCHQRMDPLGFALENFDATGRWRTEIEGQPVDAAGVLLSGESVDGPVALKEALRTRESLFLRHATEKMLAYALGRGLEFHDIAVVKEIAGRLAKDEGRVRTLILEIVKSYPFRQRRVEATDAGVAMLGSSQP